MVLSAWVSALRLGVVGVGVGSQVAHARPAPVEAGPGDSPGSSVRGEPVYGSVGAGAQPCALLYDLVCGILPYDEAEGSDGLAVSSLADEAVPGEYLRAQQFLRRVASLPLMHVAGAPHEPARGIEDPHQFAEVRRCRRTDSYVCFRRHIRIMSDAAASF